MIKIAHEAPLCIFKDVQQMTDYDYFLVHLFDECPEYYKIAKEAVASGRETILDNSIFELGEAFDMKQFAEKVIDLKPSWYIVPDSLENMSKTLSNMADWIQYYKQSIPSECKMIGVVQGTDYNEIKHCYLELKAWGVDKIAIPFDLSLYERMVPHSNKLVSWMLGRVALIGKLVQDGVLDQNIPHHLLGVALPQEGIYYKASNYAFIDSMDTSNPVCHGIAHKFYPSEGLWSKDGTKLYTMIDKELKGIQISCTKFNINAFNRFWE